MRIAWISGRPVWPAHGGGELRISGLVSEMVARGHAVTVLQPSPADPGAAPSGIATVTVPRTWTGRAKLVGKLPSRLPLHSPRIGAPGRAVIRETLANVRPDVLVVSEIHGWPLAADVANSVPFVFDAHNVEVRLMADMRRQAHGLQRIAYGIDEHRLARLEPEVLARAASTLAVSEEDASGIRKLCPGCTVAVVPSSVPLATVRADPAAAPTRILFVGQLDFTPNVLAVVELATKILPSVRRTVPHAELLVVGRRPTVEVRSILERTPGAHLVADAPTLDPHYLSARLAALPIRVGSGSRLKVFEALSYGLPIVSTATGVSGIDLAPGVEYVAAESTDELVSAVTSLLTDPMTATLIGAAGRARFEASLTWSGAADVLGAVLERVASSPTGG